MLPNIINKQKLLYFPAIALFILGWLFLLNLHSDHLIKHAPSNAGVYINTNTKFINKLPQNQYQLFLQWLGKNSRLDASQWQEAFNAPQEISFFSLNGEFFGIMEKNKLTLLIAKTHLKNYIVKDNAIIFPSVKTDITSLAETALFNETKRKINFSPLNAYVKNIAEIRMPLPGPTSNRPIAILGKMSGEQLKLTIFGDVGQNEEKTINGQKFIPDSIKLFIRNISFSSIKEETGFGKANFVFQLLKSISGSVELYLFDSSFVLHAQKQLNPIEQLKKNISLILANIYPLEKMKILPDGTSAVHFIADPTKWGFFKENGANNQIKYKLLKPKQDLHIEVEEKGDLLTISNNRSQITAGSNNIKVKKILRSCSFLGNGIIFYQLNDSGFDKDTLNITIVNINSKKIRFCIN